MKKINLIERLWTDSHEKQSPQRFFRYAAILIMLLTLGVGQMWAWRVYFGETTTQPNIYIWNSNVGADNSSRWETERYMTQVPGTNNVWYFDVSTTSSFNCIFRDGSNNKLNDKDITVTANNLKFGTSGTNGTSYTPPTFTVSYNANGGSGSTSSHTGVAYNASVTLRANGFTRSNYTFAGWNTAANGTGTYYAPGASYTVTANQTFYAMWVPTAVLGGTNVMAYCGELTSWSDNYNYQFKNSSGTRLANISISGSISVVDDTYRTGVVTLAPNTTYYNQGHWDSGLDCAIEAGYLYVVRGSKTSTYFTQKDVNSSNYLYRVSQQNGSTAATRTVTTTLGSSSFTEGTSTLSVSTSGGPGKSVLGRTNKLLYFLYNGSTWSLVQLSAGKLDVSSLTDGSYSLASVLFDGYIYVRADKDDFNVYAVYSIAYKDQGNVDYSGSNLASLPTSYNHGTGIASLTAGEKTGYDFDGWFDNSSCTGDAVTSISSSATGNKTFYAKWTAKNYTASNNIKHADGTTAGQYNVNYDATSISYTTTPSKTGYNIEGLYYESGLSNKIVNSDRSLRASTSYTTSGSKWNQTSAPNLYVKWEVKTYTESGNLKETDGTSNGTYTATYNANTITINTTPTKSGYHVEGYYTSSGLGTKVAAANGNLVADIDGWTDGSSRWVKDANVPLYIKWEADAASYIITYGVGTDYTSYGSVSEASSYASGSLQTSGTEISLTATPATHYKLEGWYTNAACTTAVVGAGTLNPYEFTLGANTSVYAKFILKQCTISLDKNGGSTGAASVTASHGSTLPSFTAHSRTGYILNGYYTASSDGTKIIDANGALVASTDYANSDKQWNNDATALTLFAQWTAKTTTVTLDNQSATTGGEDEITATYDAAVPSIAANLPEKTGYTFGGYYTETDGEGTKYINADGSSAKYWDIEDATKTLYAKWTLISYTITYNNMTGATNHPSNPANYNITTSTITLQNPTKPGYTFGGWFTDNGTWKNQVTSIALGSTGNKVLYAKWTANSSAITYVDANSVATITSNPSSAYTDATVEFSVSLKTGYKNLTVTAVDAEDNSVTVTNPSSNTYRFTMAPRAVTVTVSATALPIVYVLKTKHANSSLGDGATGFPSTGQIWAWTTTGGTSNFYTPASWPGPAADTTATAITDDIIGDEWYRFIPNNTSKFDGSTTYHVILTSTGRIMDTQSSYIENDATHTASMHTGAIWIVPHGTSDNSAYLYTSYPDEIATPYNTTYYAGNHGSINVFGTTVTSGNSQIISTSRNRTLTATPADGYAFNRWITTGSVTVADATSATTTVTATAAGGTVTATYFEVVNSGWYIKGNPAGSDWGTPTTCPLDRVFPGETNVYYRPVTLPANDQYFRFWHDETGKPEYGASTGNLVVSKDTKYDISKDDGKGGNAFKYSAGGTVWVVVDESAKKFWLQDPVVFYSVNFGYSTGCDELTAEDGDGTALVSGNTYVAGTELVFSQTAKEGYTFKEWNTAEDGSGSKLGDDDTYSIDSLDADVNVYAIYTENMTTVSLVASPASKGSFTSGGDAVTSVSAGVTTKPSVTAVAIAGYRVNTSATVWTKNNDNITLSSATANPVTVTGCGTASSTSTLTATFTPIVYTITLNDNNGSGGVGSATVTFENDNYTYASSFVAPTRTGYIFQGYYTASAMADGTQLIDDKGAWQVDPYDYYTDENGKWIRTSDVTLYAGWTPITYTVTYYANGGSAKSEQTDPTVTNWTYDVAQYISVPSSYFDAPTKYALFSDDSKYWNDSEHGDGTDYAWGERSNLTSTDGDNIDLYAQWYTQVTLDKNHVDATNNGSMRVRYNQHVTYNKAILPSRVGYHRTGFYTASADGTKAFEADGTMVSGDVSGFIDDGYWIYTYDDAEDPYPTFYTYWAENHYSVTFDANDCASYVGEATGSKASVADVAYETYVDITAGTLAREGYTFAGWSKTACATTASYVGDTWRRISHVDGDDVTLYAVWTPKTYTISFNALGGDCYTTSKNVNMGDTYGYLPTAYGKSGYEFVGWYTRPEGGTEVTEETQMVTASDHTLYAHYEKKARVYFKNTLGWDAVYVTWDATWNYNSEDKGAGARGKTQEAMTNFYGTDIWYKDIPAAIISSWKGNIAFTSKAMNNYDWFDEGQAVYRRDFDSDATMFVPTPNDSHAYTKNAHGDKPGTEYYSTDMEVDKDGEEKITNYRYKNGYWVRYEELQAGYTLKGSWAWDDDHYVERKDLNDSTYVFTIRNLSADSEYWFNLYKHCTTSNNYSSVFKANSNITSANCTNVVFSAEYADNSDTQVTTTVAGDYTFKFVFSALGEIRLTVEYPFGVNDYRVVYSYTKDGAKTFSSEYIKAEANAVDTISMFIHSADSATARSLYIQKCTAIADGVPTWNTTYSAIALPSETASGKTSGVYNFKIAQNESSAATGESVGKYTGNYYIRTDSADGGWDHYKEYPINLMTLSEYSMTQTLSEPYSHYYCQYIGNSTTDISYTIATDYSPAICPVLEGDATIGVGKKTLPSGKPASVRFTWNQETNATFRAYLKSAQGDGNTRYLLIHGADDDMIFNTAGAVIADSVAKSMEANELLFKDTENWVYELAFKAKPGAKVSVIAQYNDVDRYLVGGADKWETIINGKTASTKYDIAAVYDFKTNRLITTWIPSGTISETISETDVLIERQYQGGGTTITFGKATEEAKAGSISAKRVIGALKFEYSDLVGRVASWNETSRAMLMYFVSFPFDVNVSDIFGLNTEYGDAFVVQHYNSKLRAEKGFFGGDGTETFWEDMPVDTVMHANVGYVVVMDNDYMNGDVGHVWDNKKPGDHVYLYFPSANDPKDPIILNSEAKTVTLPANECKINRTFNGGKLNHKYTDSNWNVMGVPIFQNHTGDATAGTPGAIFTPTEEPKDTTEFSPEFGYFYKWSTSKDYTVTAAAGFTFLPMHSYLVQYAGYVTFTQATPAPVAAPRRALKNEENYKIELQVLNSNEDMLNRTYVELREEAVDSFALNEDLFMVSNKRAVNVYTFAGTYDVSANVMSINSHIVPVGVIVKQAGTYTFTMPSDFSGTVTLVDTYTDARTNLALDNYEVNLPKGTNDERFLLEININKVPTAIDGTAGASLKDGKAHKFIEDQQMYILKNGVIYDARGQRVK